MKKSNLIFTEISTGAIISGVITYEPGETSCETCPIRPHFPGDELCMCSLLDETTHTIPRVDGISFQKFGEFFCNKAKIIAFNDITIDGIDYDRIDDFAVKYSLNDLLEKVCPGRCIFLDNPQECTKEHRKCPGCLLGELEEEED